MTHDLACHKYDIYCKNVVNVNRAMFWKRCKHKDGASESLKKHWFKYNIVADSPITFCKLKKQPPHIYLYRCISHGGTYINSVFVVNWLDHTILTISCSSFFNCCQPLLFYQLFTNLQWKNGPIKILVGPTHYSTSKLFESVNLTDTLFALRTQHLSPNSFVGKTQVSLNCFLLDYHCIVFWSC